MQIALATRTPSAVGWPVDDTQLRTQVKIC